MVVDSGGIGSQDGSGASEHWVFGYGSLMWRPGFPYLERKPAVLHGWRRAFCVHSVVHRGTFARPGLVLGLVQGGHVRGAAFRVAPEHWAETYAYLLDRENPSETYVDAQMEVSLSCGAPVHALAFLSDVQHPQWAGELDLLAQARLIAGAQGRSGRNVDYLRGLVAHLIEEGAPDRAMEQLLAQVEAMPREAAAA